MPFRQPDPDQPSSEETPPHSKSQPVSIPPPLKFHPTRARRQFAARLAERQRALQEAQEAELEHDDPDTVAATELQTTKSRHDDDPRSDDSSEDVGEEVGIMMRKGVGRGSPGAAALGLAGTGAWAGVENVPKSRTQPLATKADSARAVEDGNELGEVFERLSIDVGAEGNLEHSGVET